MNYTTGKHALVTGGGSGIGKACAAALAAAGATVTIVGRNADKLEGTAGAIGATARVSDVTDRDLIRGAIDDAVAEHGPVAILVNNAGAAQTASFAKMDDEHWDQMIDVNLHGVFNCTRAVVPSMLAAGTGRIINIASTAALKGYAYVSAYTAAKHAVLGLTRSLALEFATKGVTVNAVCPGYTNTEIVDNALERIMSATGRSREKALAEIVKANPQGRLVEPGEVGDTVVWLCEQKSMNGQAIAIAGGEVM